MTPEIYLEIALLALVGITVTAFTSIFNTWRHRLNELEKAQLTKDTAIEIAQQNKLIELEKAELHKQTAIEVAYIEKNASLEKYFTEHEIERVNKLQEAWRESSHIVTTFVYLATTIKDTMNKDTKEYTKTFSEILRIRSEMTLLDINTETIGEYIETCGFHHKKNSETREKASMLNLRITTEIYRKYNKLREKHLKSV